MITTTQWWAFLLFSPIVYWLLPAKWRAGVLALMSFCLLMVYAPLDIAVLAVIATLVFGVHHAPADGPKPLAFFSRLAASPMLLMLILAYFFWAKYLPAFSLIFTLQASVLDLVIPLGISYFTFKLLHYSIEKNRGTLPEHSYVDFASYMFLAPIFTAGPIERFEHYIEHRATKFEIDFVFEGLLRIAQGLVKKFVFGLIVLELLQRSPGGDTFELVEKIDTLTPLQIWATLSLTSLYIYLDFAAYSDIAIGSSRLFGLRIMENFNLPFMSKSLREFWQRYHMTLASWVLTYIYMPAVARTRNPFAAIVISFGVVGLWHAAWPAHWFLWGLWHGIGLAILLWWTRLFQKRRSKFLRKKPVQFLGWAITMLFVILGDTFPALYGHGTILDAFAIMLAAIGLN